MFTSTLNDTDLSTISVIVRSLFEDFIWKTIINEQVKYMNNYKIVKMICYIPSIEHDG